MERWERFDGPECGVHGCEREVGHIGDHRRVEQITPRSIDRAAFGLDDGETPVRMIPSIDEDPQSPFADLEDENADLRMTLAAASAELTRLRGAIEDFILWWDMPPFALDDDERLRAEVDALRAALKEEP